PVRHPHSFPTRRSSDLLTQEYRDLLKAIVQHNIEDREGVVEFLQQLTRRPQAFVPRIDMAVGELETRLKDIRTSHTGNGRILYRSEEYTSELQSRGHLV